MFRKSRCTCYATDVKVATWNVNGVRARAAQLADWLDREQPDVVCLQETKASLEQVPEALRTRADYHGHWHGHKGYSGVALLLRTAKLGDATTFTHPHFDLENRIVVAEVATCVFASVYVPNGGKDLGAKIVFLRELASWAAELHASGKHLVLCGDYNVARTDMDVHPTERRDGIGQSKQERALVDAIFTRGDLVDVGRHVDPDNDRLFTWWAPWRNMRERNIGWRLDYIAASSALVDETVHAAAYRDVGTSDHGPVIAHLRDTPAARKP
jgi:exodeoxyribonuclease-3